MVIDLLQFEADSIKLGNFIMTGHFLVGFLFSWLPTSSLATRKRGTEFAFPFAFEILKYHSVVNIKISFCSQHLI